MTEQSLQPLRPTAPVRQYLPEKIADEIHYWTPKQPMSPGGILEAYVKTRLASARERDPELAKQVGRWNHHVSRIRSQNASELNMLVRIREDLVAKGDPARAKIVQAAILKMSESAIATQFEVDAAKVQEMDGRVRRQSEEEKK